MLKLSGKLCIRVVSYQLVGDLPAVGDGDAAASLLGDGPAAAAGGLAAVPRQTLLDVARLALVLPLGRAALLKENYRFSKGILLGTRTSIDIINLIR